MPLIRAPPPPKRKKKKSLNNWSGRLHWKLKGKGMYNEYRREGVC